MQVIFIGGPKHRQVALEPDEGKWTEGEYSRRAWFSRGTHPTSAQVMHAYFVHNSLAEEEASEMILRHQQGKPDLS